MLAAFGVEVAGRLVGQDHRGRTGQGPRDGDPLALTAREVARPKVLAIAADRPPRAPGRPRGGPSGRAIPSDSGRTAHSREAVSDGKQVELLKNKADRPAPDFSQSDRGRFASITCPSMTMRPPVGVSRQPRMHKSVVFPEPDGPSSATTSPRSTDSETPWSTGTSCRPSR